MGNVTGPQRIPSRTRGASSSATSPAWLARMNRSSASIAPKEGVSAARTTTPATLAAAAARAHRRRAGSRRGSVVKPTSA